MAYDFEHFLNKFQELKNAQIPFVVATMVETKGSAPQDQGARILVTKEGLYFGTIGGGKVEKKVIDKAVEILNQHPAPPFDFVEWNLQKDVGMTCGGVVKIFFESYADNVWNVVVFGAGHISQALIRTLCTLKCRITCIDPRKEWLDKLPESNKLTKICADPMKEEVKNIKADSFVLLMTMGHASDAPILIEILKNKKFPYLGVIGSLSKSNVLKKDLKEAGLENKMDEFICPIGLPIGDNSPEEIAISVVAQLLEARDQFFSTSKRV